MRISRFQCLIAARVLFLVAMCVAGYLAWVSFTEGGVAGCGPESDCDKALQSRWAYWLGAPVSALAVGTYVVLLIASWGIVRSGRETREKWSWVIGVAMSVMVTGAAVWFVGVQVFILKSFCRFCMTAHFCGLIGARASVVVPAQQ